MFANYYLEDKQFLSQLKNFGLDGKAEKFFISNLNQNQQLELRHDSTFGSCWDIIHTMHNLDSQKQLQLFTKILEILSRNKCSCSRSGFEIFLGLSNGRLENFLTLRNKQWFWILFHNIINYKLSKPIYKT
jgi:hypothetical protein